MSVDGSELEGWVRLSSIPGLSSTSQRKLLSAFGSPDAALRASASSVGSILGARAMEAWRSGPDADAVARAIEWLESSGNTLLNLADTTYPQALLSTPDPPPVLYAKGRLDLLLRPALSIVGARARHLAVFAMPKLSPKHLAIPDSPSSADLRSASMRLLIAAACARNHRVSQSLAPVWTRSIPRGTNVWRTSWPNTDCCCPSLRSGHRLCRRIFLAAIA